MSISVQEAETLILNLKAKEISLGGSPEVLGFYENHIYGAANVAKTIAAHMHSINPDDVYICALLHDISRPEEERNQRFHGILGYEKLVDKDKLAA